VARVGRGPTERTVSLDIPAYWIISPDSHTNALYRVRVSLDIPHAWLALTQAVWLAACSGTLPGARPSPGVSQGASPQAPVTRSLPEAAPSIAATPSSSPATVPSAGAVGFGSSQSPAAEPAPAPPPVPAPYGPPAETAPPPAAAPSEDARDRQFEILNEAVAALRQEVSRSYERAEELGAENERLRALVASLRRDLRKSRGANKSLDDQLRALEKKLSEIGSPPPEGGAESPEERTAPTSPSPHPPEAPPPPPQAQPPSPGGGADDEGSAAPDDETE
jgi:hypothetical protein